MKPLVLTIANPQGGRQMEYEIRKRTGMNLVPASLASMRQAATHLQHGGLVVTGMDRPISEPRIRPRFFGRPAALPMHPIYLALKAGVPLRVLYVTLQADRKYYVRSSELIEMERHPDREIESLQNTETVLSIAEKFIRQAPGQWSVALPVWPDLMSLVPS
jgi:KDO2-lipid IV(A) lauroyltransferase